MKSTLLTLTFGLSLLFMVACKPNGIKIAEENWGEVDGKDVSLFTLKNNNGMEVKLTNFGGIITSIIVPDKNGKLEDVVLGFDNLKQYTDPHPCFGAIIGRFANRIRNAEFTIDNITYNLEKNDGEQCAHGAQEFNKAVWKTKKLENGIQLHHFSPDGTKGFPGNIHAYVTYIITQDNAIEVIFKATTDKATHISMTQHSYFNLTACKALIYNHQVKIDADSIPEIDSLIVPTGPLKAVKGTIADLTTMRPIGKHMFEMDYNGYHYCYVFNKKEGELKKVVEIYEPTSGRTLDVTTTQPGIQFYTGNAISDQLIGKNGIKYGMHAGFVLETQHLPDSPNHPNFPSTLLRPNEEYKEHVIYKFGVKK